LHIYCNLYVSFSLRLEELDFFVCRAIYWAEVGVIRSALDDGTNITTIATDLGNVTDIDISHGNHCD